MASSSRSARRSPTSAGVDLGLITIGRIVAPHGIRGEVRVRFETDFPERFSGLRRAYLVRDGKAEEITLEATRPHREGLLVSIGGVADRTSAEGLRDAAIAVPRADVVPLSDDSFYVFEIVGMRVQTDGGRDLGTVAEVMRGPANDVYVVRGGAREILVPAVRQVVREVDRRARIILVTLPAGLEE